MFIAIIIVGAIALLIGMYLYYRHQERMYELATDMTVLTQKQGENHPVTCPLCRMMEDDDDEDYTDIDEDEEDEEPDDPDDDGHKPHFLHIHDC